MTGSFCVARFSWDSPRFLACAGSTKTRCRGSDFRRSRVALAPIHRTLSNTKTQKPQKQTHHEEKSWQTPQETELPLK